MCWLIKINSMEPVTKQDLLAAQAKLSEAVDAYRALAGKAHQAHLKDRVLVQRIASKYAQDVAAMLAVYRKAPDLLSRLPDAVPGGVISQVPEVVIKELKPYQEEARQNFLDYINK